MQWYFLIKKLYLKFFKVDVTVFHRGFHGDLNETFFVGTNINETDKKLVKVTYECLQQAINIGLLLKI